ncbi:hypothetical protein BGLA2_180069 [Burkholderia gladioli]|nr:hypothetical protein BGLA2_180069 [Burkholderia gladioli]
MWITGTFPAKSRLCERRRAPRARLAAARCLSNESVAAISYEIDSRNHSALIHLSSLYPQTYLDNLAVRFSALA